jgi:hypothetical protein
MHTAPTSDRSILVFRALRTFFLGCAFIHPLLAQSTGVVAGQVSNAATSMYLEGADVAVDGTSRSALTDREGRYELILPAGPTTLVVRYTGLEPQRVTVDVKPGTRSVQNIEMNSGVYKLDTYTVSGPREGSAYAITRQREALNVKNVVASDSFGNIADGNIGDFLQQLPGITAVYVGADVRSVQIRGIDGSLNAVTMDGDRVASSQSACPGRFVRVLAAADRDEQRCLASGASALRTKFVREPDQPEHRRLRGAALRRLVLDRRAGHPDPHSQRDSRRIRLRRARGGFGGRAGEKVTVHPEHPALHVLEQERRAFADDQQQRADHAAAVRHRPGGHSAPGNSDFRR